jgi:hypothetical protein
LSWVLPLSSASIRDILALLRGRGGRATFHVLTSKLENNPDGIDALKTASVFRNTIGLYTRPDMDLNAYSDSVIAQYLKVSALSRKT